MSYNKRNNNKEKPLLASEIERLALAISKSLENVISRTEDLTDLEERIGTSGDTKALRDNIRVTIDQVQNEIKQALDYINEFESLEVKSKTEQDNRNKMAKRFRDAFNKDKDKFTQIMKQIHTKEKIHIDIRRKSIARTTTDSYSEAKSPLSRDENNKNDDINIQEIEYMEEDIHEREKEIDKVKQVIALMADLSKHQEEEIMNQREDLEVIIENLETTKETTHQANKQLEISNKYQKESTKRNLYICLIICLLAAIVIGITLYTQIGPQNNDNNKH